MEVNHSGFWDMAYRDNAPELLGVLRRYVKDVNNAQDLLHEAFITAMDKYDGYAGRGSFDGWLYRITVNTALMHLRNERINPLETWCAAPLPIMEDDNDTDFEQVDDVRAVIEAAEFSGEELLSAIDRLPEHHKLVFNMYVMDNFSHKQIAAELNISQGTSKSHLARARKKIQQFLYNDALNKKKSRDKRRASALLLLFPAKNHYIDKLYREGLSHFTISPTESAEFLSATINQQATSGYSHSKIESWNHGTTFLGNKMSYMAVCCGTAAITGTVCWLSMSGNSPLNRDIDRMNSEITVGDTLKYLPHPSEEDITMDDAAGDDHKDAAIHHDQNAVRKVSTGESSSSEKSAPVVVKKQIIQYQTVVLRDTIFIIE